MTELTLATADLETGRLIVDSSNRQVADIIEADGLDLGKRDSFGCARPVEVLHPNPVFEQPAPHVRINGFWHNSLVEGPGRRSVVRMQGCPIRCEGCWVPQTHDPDAGYDVSVHWLVDALLDPKYERDGVTIIGGEPFAQPGKLALLLMLLRRKQPELHIAVYTGYVYETLLEHLKLQSLSFVFDHIDILIDGPYVKGLASSAGPWTGSGNQRVIFLH